MVPIVATLLSLGYTGGFREGDWVNYTSFRYVSSAAIDHSNVYFGTTGGVIRFDRYANRWLDPMTVTDGIPERRVSNIAYNPDDDRLWVATPLGNAYYQPTFQQWYPGGDFPAGYARNDLRPAELGVLNTEFGYTYQNGRLSDMDFRSFQLTRGVSDGFDRLYAGTWGLGPVVINPRYGDLKRMPYGLYSEDATAIVRVGDKFWIGGGAVDPEAGITLCDTALQDWHWYESAYTGGLASSRITCAIGDGRVTWLGTDYGLLRYDSDGERFATLADFSSLPSVMVTSLAADSAWIFVGTDAGLGYVSRELSKQENRKREKKADSPEEDTSLEAGMPISGKNRLVGWRVNTLEVIENFLYVGTNRGVLRRPMGDYGDFELVNTPDGMLSDDILDIVRSGDSLLFAARNDIIVINQSTGAASTITDQSYFGSWRIRKIAVDHGRIWGATSLGLWMYRLSDGYSRLFTENDGLISADIKGLEVLGDHVWLATPQGVTRFLWNRPGRVD